MAIARKMYLFVAALFAFVLVGAPVEVEAQDGGLICGWCKHTYDVVDYRVYDGQWYQVLGNIHHYFPGGGDECGWVGSAKDHILVGPYCARCGGSSDCHTDEEPSTCHILCGPEGDIYAALIEIEAGLDRNDIAAVASALLEPQAGFFFEFVPTAGRIDVVLSCDATRAFRSIPVLPEANGRLKAATALHRARSAQ